MKDRITQFLTREGISPAEFADKIGVQRSSVSHVLNGRNYPSASFIQKMLGSYKSLNPRWLLLGEGTMSESKSIQSNKEPDLFQTGTQVNELTTRQESVKASDNFVNPPPVQPASSVATKQAPLADLSYQDELNFVQSASDLVNVSTDNKEIERIVILFKDKTFTTYNPSK